MESENIAENLPSRQFTPRLYGVGAWTGHLHFACDLVALLRPRTLVELGVDRGESYFTFCQAAAEAGTGTRCFAVDTWTGDEHAGGYDETTFAEVSAHNRAHYAAFSTLMRMNFDEALERFQSEEIDVLHIDGLHTEKAVRHDVESWLPKLARGGVLLLHDVSVRSRDFGVWKIWEELAAGGRSWTFPDGPGLGVWQKPPAQPLPAPLEALLTGPNESSAVLMNYYRQCAAALQETIARHWRDESIRDTPVAQQTVIQVFFARDGGHREEDSAFARIGHGEWKELTIRIPPGGCQERVRIDFVSALTTIDVGLVALSASDGSVFYKAETADELANIEVGGDAVREPSASALRLRITGIDPQLYLPRLEVPEREGPLLLELKLRVNTI